MKKYDNMDFVLGKAPTHIAKEDLLSYFVYAYELSWTLPMFRSKKDKMMEFIEQEIKKESIDTDALSVEKQWWLFVFITFREMLTYHSAEFAFQTVQHLIRQMSSASEESLCLYANMVHSIMMKDLPDVLVVRPLEMKPIQTILAESDLSVVFFMDRHEAIVKVIRKHINQKDLKLSYFGELLMKDRSILRKFSNIYNVYFEVLMHFFISTYDYKMSPQEMTPEVLEKAISDLVLLFVAASVETKPKIEGLHKDLFEIVKEIKNIDQSEQSE